MLEHIITKMVLDRACPICGGVQHFKRTASAKTESIVCSNCNGKGYMQDTEPSVLIVQYKDSLPIQVISTMKQQQMYVVDSIDDKYLKGLKPKRIYGYNINLDNEILRYLSARHPKEIHLY